MQEYVDYLFPGPILLDIDKYMKDADDGIKDTNNEMKCFPSKKKSSIVYFLNPFDITNTAFILSFFNVGIASGLLNVPVSYYLIKTLGISATQYSAYSALITIPWSLKFVFGMISDGIPILKYKRKPYFTIGWVGFIGVNFYLAYTGPPSLSVTIGLMFLQTCLYMLADVVSDTMAVERSRFERQIIRGSIQTSCYTIRAFGGVIGSVLGAVLYNIPIYGWGLTINELFLLSALIPLITLIPFIPVLEELITTKIIPDLKEQILKLWEVVQLRAVYQTAGYVFFYGLFQIPNGAFTNFLVVGLNFTDFDIGMLTVAGYVLTWLGMIVYRTYFFDTSWRNIYIYTTIFGCVFSLLQIILILQLNIPLGIPNFYFALGDSAIVSVIVAIQYMPSCIMFSMLCPEGYEGLVYATLTTTSNLSGTIASDIGSLLTLGFNVSNDTLESGDYSGVLYLAIITSIAQLFPLCFVWLLPDSRSEQMKLKDSGETSQVAGAIFAFIVFASLIIAITVSVVLIFGG